MATSNKNKAAEPVLEEEVAEEIMPAEIPDEKDEIIKSLQAKIAQMEKNAPKAEEPAPLPADAPMGDIWEEYIDVVVPRHGRGQEKYFFVAVNGRTAQIPADGKMQHIRKPLALALLASLEDEAKAEQFAEDLPHDAAPASFADLLAMINSLKNQLRANGIQVG